MPDWLRWLVGTGGLERDSAGLTLRFAIDLPAWGWALVVTGAVLMGVWSYQRLQGPRYARVGLGAARALLLMLLVLLLTGPKLARTSETVERDWVLVLVDRSASMTIEDAPGAGSGEGASRRSREAQLQDLLARNREVLTRLGDQRVVVYTGFDAGTHDLAPPTGPGAGAPPTELPAPTGRRSDLGGAIERVLAKAAARPISGIVVLSDGQATDQIAPSLVRRLKADRIGVYSVPLGSAEALPDLKIREAQGPGAAFIRDIVPVSATIDLTGVIAGTLRAKAQLVDLATGDVLDEQPITLEPTGPDQRTGRVRLASRPQEAGKARWAVRLVSEGARLLRPPGDVPITLDLIDRPLRVLYVDGYPRWEYRYLKNLLAREKTIAFSALLLAPGRRYLQEGTTLLESLPTRPEEWDQFDVIILGDVRPEVFSKAQLDQLRRRVSVGGGGLLWIGGQGPTPSAWRATSLGDLLPFSLTSAVLPGGVLSAWDQDVTLAPTPLAERLGVMRLADLPDEQGRFWPAAVSDPEAGWSRLRFAQRLDPAALKPAAEVLAEAAPASGDARPSPAVITMRYGSGRVVYVATDEIWRWRYGRGEDLPERFWLQLVRLLGRDAVDKSGKPAVLTFTPARSAVGQAVTVSVQLLDQALQDEARSSIGVRIARLGDVGAKVEPGSVEPEDPANPAVTLSLRPGAAGRGGGAGGGAGGPGGAGGAGGTGEGGSAWYSATWVPAQPGAYRGVVTDAMTAQTPPDPARTVGTDTDPKEIAAEAEVFLPDDELRKPQSNHPLLASLSEATGGVVLPAGDLSSLEQALPRREVRLPGAGEEKSLWDSPLALLLVIGLLTVEWVGRRLIRLV